MPSSHQSLHSHFEIIPANMRMQYTGIFKALTLAALAMLTIVQQIFCPIPILQKKKHLDKEG